VDLYGRGGFHTFGMFFFVFFWGGGENWHFNYCVFLARWKLTITEMSDVSSESTPTTVKIFMCTKIYLKI